MQRLDGLFSPQSHNDTKIVLCPDITEPTDFYKEVGEGVECQRTTGDSESRIENLEPRSRKPESTNNEQRTTNDTTKNLEPGIRNPESGKPDGILLFAYHQDTKTQRRGE